MVKWNEFGLQPSLELIKITIQLVYLLPVDDQAEDPHHPALAVHQVLLHVVAWFALSLSITREIGLRNEKISNMKTFVIKDSDIFQ